MRLATRACRRYSLAFECKGEWDASDLTRGPGRRPSVSSVSPLSPAPSVSSVPSVSPAPSALVACCFCHREN